MTKSGNLNYLSVRKVNDETKVIKYDNIPQEIYIKVMGIAEDNNIVIYLK